MATLENQGSEGAAVNCTTMSEVKALVMKPGDDATSVGLIDGKSFALAQRIGTMLSQSTIVPKAYQGNVGNCVIALNMAARIGADPIMVAQNLYVVHGNPSWSAQFLIACFNKCGRFSSLRYEFGGKEGEDSWSCRAWAVEKETGERLDGTVVSISMAKKEGWYAKSGSKWQTMPQQMLMYRAASWFVRAYAPEIAMGLHTSDEIRDTYDMEPDADGSFTVSDLRAQAQASTTPSTDPTLHTCTNDTDVKVPASTCRTCNDFPTCSAPHPDASK